VLTFSLLPASQLSFHSLSIPILQGITALLTHAPLGPLPPFPWWAYPSFTLVHVVPKILLKSVTFTPLFPPPPSSFAQHPFSRLSFSFPSKGCFFLPPLRVSLRHCNHFTLSPIVPFNPSTVFLFVLRPFSSPSTGAGCYRFSTKQLHDTTVRVTSPFPAPPPRRYLCQRL